MSLVLSFSKVILFIGVAETYRFWFCAQALNEHAPNPAHYRIGDTHSHHQFRGIGKRVMGKPINSTPSSYPEPHQLL